MFRKIVSNLPFSPALVGQLGFYARRLRKEETTRKAGLIVTALALVVQSFAVFSPPEAVNASSTADFFSGGYKDKADYINHYNKDDTGGLKQVMRSIGITEAEGKNVSVQTIGEKGYYNWSKTSLYSYAQGQRSWDVGGWTAYYRPMTLTAGANTNHKVLVGHSATFGWFAIKIDCGNLVTKTPPKRPPAPEAKCKDLEANVSEQRVTLTGKAKVKNKAKIKAYVFNVTNANDTTVYHNKVETGKESQSVTFSLAPGRYAATLKVKTTEGDRGGADCKTTLTVPPPPATPKAICTSVKASIVNRVSVQLSGTALASDGATISEYIFTVKDKDGNVVATKPVSTTAESAVVETFDITTPGEYSVQLAVKTSIGEVTDPTACVASFPIAPPEVCPYNNSLPPNDPACQPCPDNPDIWVKDEKCTSDIINTKAATNITQGNINATTKIAHAGDRISYTLTVENKGIVSDNVTIKESLRDVLEYANLVDSGGGTFDKKSITLTWPEINVAGGAKETRSFVVQMMEKIPVTNTGTSDEDSYDCKMVNTFGNAVEINVKCANEKKVVEQVVKDLPKTGPGENMIFAGSLFAVVSYFYARSRQLGKEVRLVRKKVHAGTI
ncbi:MAG TPA: hypothetical protein VGE34_04905 [Candidatus Saccharimonadales bacterium]